MRCHTTLRDKVFDTAELPAFDKLPTTLPPSPVEPPTLPDRLVPKLPDFVPKLPDFVPKLPDIVRPELPDFVPKLPDIVRPELPDWLFP